MKGVYFDAKRYAIHDGPGIRTAVFFKGCPLACVWCHNPQSIALSPQIESVQNRCRNCGTCLDNCETQLSRDKCTQCGKCVLECAFNARQLIGKITNPQALVSLILRDKPFFDQSGGGVTFTGGEPLLQHEFLLVCLELCKQNNIHTAIDTCGFDQGTYLPKIAPLADLILFDIKLMNEEHHKHYTGVSNSLILKSLRFLDDHHKNIWIRVPVIPKITATRENMEAIGDFVSSLKNTRRVHLLAYHNLGAKRQSVNEVVKSISSPTKEELVHAKKILQKYGLEVYLSG